MAKFKFLNLGQRVDVSVNNISAQTNTYYEDSDTITVEKNDSTQYGEPFDEIQFQGFYQSQSEELKSNISKIFVNFPPDKTLAPESVNNEITIDNNQQISIIDSIFYNSAVDRIKILDFENIGQLTFNSNFIFQNKEVLQYDFNKIKFKSNASGIGFPYQKIKYQVGNLDGYNSTIYLLTINIDGLASLVEVDDPDVNANEESKSIIYNIQIVSGIINKNAKVQIETSFPPEVFTDPDSSIKLIYRNNVINIKDNGIIEITTVLDQDGKDDLYLEIDLFLENNNIDAFVKFTLLEVDNNASLVSINNEQTLTLTSV